MSLSAFSEKASTDNLKQVGSLAGIGKGTLAMVGLGSVISNHVSMCVI